ncbi:MAG: tRNA preQ1(34) S-adenosylmethionine ribosyltransferase-isomerase QueA [Gammaproteobacteria bacterium]|jgi:S-adenosylmethionine:tRNA ribosyltransferase-isomerase
MDRSAFHFELPQELIAQEPLPDRTGSRLLVLDGASGRCRDRRFPALAELLRSGDLVVLNDTRVIPARLHGRKLSGGRVEILIERVTGPTTALAQVRASKTPRPGSEIYLPGDAVVRVEGRAAEFFELRFDQDLEPYLSEHGEVPLPPYIERAPTTADNERYQTVFANEPGAVAAPTAGLHFDAELLARLARLGIDHAFLTLHVGAGTFAPVRTQRAEDHRLHKERATVPEDLCERIEQTKAAGGRIVAVGTTTVRALESAALGGELAPFDAETDLFIYPGFRFRVVDAIVTNFHLPESSLLMLIAAFASRETVLAAYTHAVAERYRFFSYGDAMFVTPADDSSPT